MSKGSINYSKKGDKYRTELWEFLQCAYGNKYTILSIAPFTYEYKGVGWDIVRVVENKSNQELFMHVSEDCDLRFSETLDGKVWDRVSDLMNNLKNAEGVCGGRINSRNDNPTKTQTDLT
jgi:hypothetical protein